MKCLIVLFFLISVSENFSSGQPQILWWFDTNDSAFGQSAMDDLDGDGKYEIAFGCYRNDSMVYVINADDGSLKWKYNTSGFQEGCNDTPILLFDVNNDNKKEVIVASSCNPYTYCFNGETGEVIWKTFVKRGSDSPPTIADLDNDGKFEILHGQFGGFVICLNADDGSIKWELEVDSNSWIQTAPTIADLNNDGRLDFVVATWHFDDGNKVYAYNGKDTTLLWVVDVNDYVYHGSAVVDLNFNGEMVVIIGDYSGRLYAIAGATSEVLWTFDSDGYIGSPVSVADITGDGQYEIVFCGGYNIYALNHEGKQIWKYIIPDYKTAFRGVVLSDIDNDGIKDIIFGTSGGKLIALNSENGYETWIVDLAEHIGKDFDINHAPLIGDLNGNGLLDVFIIGGYSNMPEFENNYGRAYTLEIGEGEGPEWKMFQNNIRRTGTIEIVNSSIRDNNSKANISVYPNPVSVGQKTTIESDECTISSFVITDLTGRIIHADILNNREIYIDFAKGLFFLNIYCGDEKVVKKLIVK